ncbi:hypothetical protein BHE74_00057588, partial [Ensete ventricosum]
PSFTLTTPLPLRRRRLPFATDSRPPLLVAGLSTGGNPLRAGRSRPCPQVAAPCGLLPLRAITTCRGHGHSQSPLYRGALATAGHPLQVAMAVASHLCMQTACMWPPLPRWQRLLSEIVYHCVPDPDGEDEGGQASSSLAISTRWISAAKLLQSDLATLALKEGGE